MSADRVTAEDAFDIGRSDGLAWYQTRDTGALAGDNEGMIPDDVYPAYVRGVAAGIQEAPEATS